MKRNILLLLALLLLALPASARRHKPTEQERALAIAQVVELLKTDRWTLFIERINSNSVDFSQLVPERNYVYVENGHLILQTDKTYSYANANFMPRHSPYSRARYRQQLHIAMRPVDRRVYDVVVQDISLNRKGTKVIYSVIMADEHGRRTRQHMTINPVTLDASIGIYQGHIKPVEEVLVEVKR